MVYPGDFHWKELIIAAIAANTARNSSTKTAYGIASLKRHVREIHRLPIISSANIGVARNPLAIKNTSVRRRKLATPQEMPELNRTAERVRYAASPVIPLTNAHFGRTTTTITTTTTDAGSVANSVIFSGIVPTE
jgi:hypothetical protein